MLQQDINEDLKKAIRSKEEIRLSCLRLLKASIKNKQVEKGRDLTDEEVIGLISSAIKKGKEAVEAFRKGKREDLASKEESEIKIFQEYLPKQLGTEEIEKIVREVVSQLGATGPKDLGRVMKEAVARMAGRADGKTVNEIARKVLSK
jgi:uncharacterized protein YqeY